MSMEQEPEGQLSHSNPKDYVKKKIVGSKLNVYITEYLRKPPENTVSCCQCRIRCYTKDVKTTLNTKNGLLYENGSSVPVGWESQYQKWEHTTDNLDTSQALSLFLNSKKKEFEILKLSKKKTTIIKSETSLSSATAELHHSFEVKYSFPSSVSLRSRAPDFPHMQVERKQSNCHKALFVPSIPIYSHSWYSLFMKIKDVSRSECKNASITLSELPCINMQLPSCGKLIQLSSCCCSKIFSLNLSKVLHSLQRFPIKRFMNIISKFLELYSSIDMNNISVLAVPKHLLCFCDIFVFLSDLYLHIELNSSLNSYFINRAYELTFFVMCDISDLVLKLDVIILTNNNILLNVGGVNMVLRKVELVREKYIPRTLKNVCILNLSSKGIITANGHLLQLTTKMHQQTSEHWIEQMFYQCSKLVDINSSLLFTRYCLNMYQENFLSQGRNFANLNNVSENTHFVFLRPEVSNVPSSIVTNHADENVNRLLGTCQSFLLYNVSNAENVEQCSIASQIIMEHLSDDNGTIRSSSTSPLNIGCISFSSQQTDHSLCSSKQLSNAEAESVLKCSQKEITQTTWNKKAFSGDQFENNIIPFKATSMCIVKVLPKHFKCVQKKLKHRSRLALNVTSTCRYRHVGHCAQEKGLETIFLSKTAGKFKKLKVARQKLFYLPFNLAKKKEMSFFTKMYNKGSLNPYSCGSNARQNCMSLSLITDSSSSHDIVNFKNLVFSADVQKSAKIHTKAYFVENTSFPYFISMQSSGTESFSNSKGSELIGIHNESCRTMNFLGIENVRKRSSAAFRAVNHDIDRVKRKLSFLDDMFKSPVGNCIRRRISPNMFSESGKKFRKPNFSVKKRLTYQESDLTNSPLAKCQLHKKVENQLLHSPLILLNNKPIRDFNKQIKYCQRDDQSSNKLAYEQRLEKESCVVFQTTSESTLFATANNLTNKSRNRPISHIVNTREYQHTSDTRVEKDIGSCLRSTENFQKANNKVKRKLFQEPSFLKPTENKQTVANNAKRKLFCEESSLKSTENSQNVNNSAKRKLFCEERHLVKISTKQPRLFSNSCEINPFHGTCKQDIQSDIVTCDIQRKRSKVNNVFISCANYINGNEEHFNVAKPVTDGKVFPSTLMLEEQCSLGFKTALDCNTAVPSRSLKFVEEKLSNHENLISGEIKSPEYGLSVNNNEHKVDLTSNSLSKPVENMLKHNCIHEDKLFEEKLHLGGFEAFKNPLEIKNQVGADVINDTLYTAITKDLFDINKKETSRSGVEKSNVSFHLNDISMNKHSFVIDGYDQKSSLTPQPFLKKSVHIFNNDHDKENIFTSAIVEDQNKKCAVGFRTAAGHNINVSTKSLEYIKKMLPIEDDLSSDEVSLNEYSSVVQIHDQDTTLKNTSFLKPHAKLSNANFDKIDTEIVQEQTFAVGFQTAAGNNVNVSAKSLEYVKKKLAMEDDLRFDEVHGNECSSVVESYNQNTTLRSEPFLKPSAKLSNNKSTSFVDSYGKNASLKDEAFVKPPVELINADFHTVDAVDIQNLDKKYPVGFQTAAGRNINISVKRLEHVKKMLPIEDDFSFDKVGMNESTSFVDCYNENASLKDEEFLKPPLELINADFDKVNNSAAVLDQAKKCAVEFETAAGHNICASAKSLEYVKKMLRIEDDVSFDEVSLSEDNSVVDSHNQNTSLKYKQFLKACAELSNTASDKVNTADILDQDKKYTVGFQTAAGNNVNVLAKSLKYIKKKLAMEDDLCFGEVSMNECSSAVESFNQNTSLRSGPFLKPSAKLSSNDFDEENEFNTKIAEVYDEKCVLGFQTASGHNVSVSAKSLEHVKKMLPTEADFNFDKVSVNESTSYVDSYGENASLKDKAFFKPPVKRNNADFDTVDLQNLDKKCPVGFQTAAGHNINVSAKSLEYIKKMLPTEDDLNSDKVSFNEYSSVANSHDQNTGLKNKPFLRPYAKLSNADFDKVDTEIAQNQDQKCVVGFQTAAGQDIHISAKSLEYVKKKLATEDDLSFGEVFVDEYNSIEDSYGQNAVLRNKPFSKPSAQLSNTDFDEENELIPEYVQNQNEKRLLGFQTAAGCNVNVSSKSLEYIKKLFATEDDLGFDEVNTNEHNSVVDSYNQSTSVRNKSWLKPSAHLLNADFCKDNEFNTKIAQDNDGKCIVGFQTAAGSDIHISAKSLEYVKTKLATEDGLRFDEVMRDEYCSTVHSCDANAMKPPAKLSNADLDEKNEFHTEFVRNQNKKCVVGFQTASGHNISVSAKSLEHVKKKLTAEDVESPDEVNKNEYNLHVDNYAQSTSLRSKSFLNVSPKLCNTGFDKENEFNNETIQDRHEKCVIGFQVTSSESIEYVNDKLNKKCNLMNSKEQNAKLGVPLLSSDTQQLNSIDNFSKTDADSNLCDDFGSIKNSAEKHQLHDSIDKIYLQTNICSNNEFVGFQTATGKGLIVSDKALNFVKRKFSSISSDEITNPAESEIQNTNYKNKKPKVLQSHFLRTANVARIPRSEPCKCVRKSFPFLSEKTLVVQQGSCDKIDSLASFIAYSTSEIDYSVSKFTFICPHCNGPSELACIRKNAKSQVTFNPKDMLKKTPTKMFCAKVCKLSNKVSQQFDNQPILALMEQRYPSESAAAEEIEVLRQKQQLRIAAKVNDKICPGQLSILKENARHTDKMKLKTLTGSYPSAGPIEQLSALGIKPQTISVTSASAENFIFGENYFTGCHSVGPGCFTIGDGASVILNQDKCAGKQELFSAFLDSSGVDPSLITDTWFYNHYRWIVWKLASTEISFPSIFGGRYLVPDRVVLQMKFRYDREIDQGKRSALKRIIERDDTPVKTLVLLISAIIKHRKDEAEEKSEAQYTYEVKVSDGWYEIPAKVDSAMMKLIDRNKLNVGYKIITSGAELIGSDVASSPLEIPEGLKLKINTNSTRIARWDVKLGYYRHPQPFPTPLSSLLLGGGCIGLISIVVSRAYPVMFMEKYSDGQTVIRNEKMELKVKEYHSKLQERCLNRIRSNVLKTFEDDSEKKQACDRKRFVQPHTLLTGEEIFEAYNSTADEQSFLELLNDNQMSLLKEFEEKSREKRRFQLEKKINAAIIEAKDAGEYPADRNVIPLLKVYIKGYHKSDLQYNKGILLNVWRPSSDVLELFTEGSTLKIYFLLPSRYKDDVSLNSMKATRYECSTVGKETLEAVYQPRTVTYLGNISESLKNTDIDVVGLIFHVSKSDENVVMSMDMVYITDVEFNMFVIKFPDGLSSSGCQDILVVGNIITACNLKLNLNAGYVSVSAISTIVSTFSCNPKATYLKEAIEDLQNQIKDINQFIETAKEVFVNQLNEKRRRNYKRNSDSFMQDDNYCAINMAQKKRRSEEFSAHHLNSVVNNISSPSVDGECYNKCPVTSNYVPKPLSTYAEKRLSKLQRIPSPPTLPKLHLQTSVSVKSTFRSPLQQCQIRKIN